MTVLKFSEYAPDISPFQDDESNIVLNVFPRKDGYGPVQTPSVYSTALPAACRGAFYARNADASITLFAATSTRLWKLSNTDFTWVPIDKVAALTSIDVDNSDSFCKSLLHCNGADASTTFTDSNTGGSAHVWTAANNAQIDTADYVFGFASGLFDGTGDRVTTPAHANFNLGTSDFTIETWFKCNVAAGSQRRIAGQFSGVNAADSFAIHRDNASSVIVFTLSDGASDTLITGTTAFTDAVNTGWHHLAIERTGNVLKMFLNGVQEGGDVAFTGTVPASALDLQFGDYNSSGANGWLGWLDEFRFSVGTARYTATFTPGHPALSTLTAHGLAIGDAVVFSTSSALPTGLVIGTVYYVISTDFTSSTFKVATSVGGTAINISSAGAGTQSYTAQYSAVPTGDQWQFAQFNNFVFAVQTNVAPQVFDLTASTAFADLTGSPPQSRYISIVNRFVVLSGLGSATPYRIQWSGLNATTTWTSGVNSSDFQDLPDGGPVRGVAGGEYGLILQDSSIRRMTFVGGSLVFQIDRVAQDRGILAPLSVCQAGERVFYAGIDGFKMYIPGGYPVSIGKERVDRLFLGDLNSSALQLCIGASDPKATRVYFAYKSLAGVANVFDKTLVYDYALDKWALITNWMGEYLTSMATPGLTLEGLDAISSSIDALAFSMDDIATGSLSRLSMFDSSHKLNFISGANAEATIDTSEQEADGQKRLRVQGMRPITDAATCYGSVGARETNQAAITYSTEQLINAKGFVPANVSTRLARGRLRVPAGTVWTFATGLEPMSAPEGRW